MARANAAPDAQTYRFLATQGISAGGLDPSALELASSSLADWEVGGAMEGESWDGDVDRLLDREQRQILVQVVYCARIRLLIAPSRYSYAPPVPRSHNHILRVRLSSRPSNKSLTSMSAFTGVPSRQTGRQTTPGRTPGLECGGGIAII